MQPLVRVGEDCTATSAQDSVDLELRIKLAKALPKASRVLAVGAAHLRADYGAAHGAATWCDATGLANLPGAKHGRFDLIVIGESLDRLPEPLRLLKALRVLAAEGCHLLLHLGNFAHWASLEHLIDADLSSEDMARRHLFSSASAYKLMMDAGWMPHAADICTVPGPNHEALQAGALALAGTSGTLHDAAARTVRIARRIIDATASFAAPDRKPAKARFTVVVPTTRESQLRLNIERSPGLREVQAKIVSVLKATSPAHALEQGLAHCDTDWVLLCHQDVYFPSSFGAQLDALLARIPDHERDATLIGFAGMAVNEQGNGYAEAGFLIDRLQRFDRPASDRAVSIDEVAIVLSRRSLHRIDPRMGWHLWATDLCVTSICQHQVFPRIVRLPLFHNSINDYGLPPGFHESAAVLAAKHASFGPIPTLCGMVAPPPVPKAAPPKIQGRIEGKHLLLDSFATDIDRLIAQQQPNAALQMMMAGVHHTYRLPEVAHQALYYPQFDRQLAQLADLLAQQTPAAQGAPSGTLLIATELYDLGGHSRALEDVSHEVDRPTVVLTDVFGTYARDPSQLDGVKRRFAHAQLVVLPDADLWTRSRMLRELVGASAPERVLYFGHHQDPVPFVGTLATPARKVLFHHGDHNPSLGCTLGLEHVDFTESLRDTCTRELGQQTTWLPLYVPDLGTKPFAPVRGRSFSVVTSGHPAKFARSGAHALQAIALSALRAIDGRFFHIGPLDAQWQDEVRRHLDAHGIDASRFVSLGLVPSVWGALRELDDAAFYIGSAPVSGGRAGVEAQGCGYPVLYFKGFEAGSLLADFSSYGLHELGWSDVDELGRLLRDVGERHAGLSAAARRFYEQGFSRERYREVLAHALS